jgi:hypothetical protein
MPFAADNLLTGAATALFRHRGLDDLATETLQSGDAVQAAAATPASKGS